MNIETWLSSSEQTLQKAGIATARLDCLVLLEDATTKDRSWLLAHLETEVKGPTLAKLDEQIERRSKHEPLAYIRGKSEFYGREFKVTPYTLQPRPETETMITLLKTTDVRVRLLRVVDMGTGSGCIAVTTKLEMPGLEVMATDVSDECIEVARQNAKKLDADVAFYHGNLLEPVSTLCTPNTALLCNLPYVPNSHTINQAAMQEPELAIFGGDDGLDLYRELFEQIKTFDLSPKLIMTESLPFQHHNLALIARNYDYVLGKTDDFIQIFVRG